jgi:hypothetical protein
MSPDQRTVAVGAASGIVTMIVLVSVLTMLIEAPAIPDTAGDRLAYAARWLVVAVLPLFAMIVTIGNARFAGEAIDPTLHREDPRMVVDGRVTENTVQQFVIFVVALLALSVLLPARWLSVVPAETITFVIARLVFWFGYRIHPLYRAPGFSSTAYLNLGMLGASLWLWLR